MCGVHACTANKLHDRIRRCLSWSRVGKRFAYRRRELMLRRCCVVFAAALLLAPAISQAQFKQGDWELTLSGQGANGPDFNGFTASAAGNLGYFLTDALEVGVRQTLGY